VAVELDVIVDVGLGLLPLGELERRGGQRTQRLLTAVDSRTNPASTAGTAQHDLDLVSG